MAEPVRIGVVGLGWVAQARHIPTIRSDPRYRLIGVADRNGERALKVAQSLSGVREGTGTRLADLPWINDVDAISIATAPFAHHDLACEALDRGLHVITEKPFAMSPSEGQAMLASSLKSNRTLAVVHNFQFARSMKRLFADLKDGRLGEIRGIRAIQFGNPSRRLPEWYEQLPLGLFYDESPHLLYLLAATVGPLRLEKSISIESRHAGSTPHQIDAWFSAVEADFPIGLSCNFESAVSEWYFLVHGENGLAIVDIFRDIYMYLPNDGRHSTLDVIRTSASATLQHWWQHVASGVPYLAGKLRYGNDEVFRRFAQAINGELAQLEPIGAESALFTLALQHDIIEKRERIQR